MSESKNSTRLKILVLAEECNPDWHSLPALVYQYVEALSACVEIVLITHVRNRENLSDQPLPNVRIEYIDTEWVAAPLHRIAEMLSRDSEKAMTLKVALKYPGYLFFEWLVWRAFRKQIIAGEFDIVHRISPMSPTIPSPIAKWCKSIPFVIGPLLGGLAWPPGYRSEMIQEGEWMNFFRGLHRWLPYYRATYTNADAILAAYPHTIEDIPANAKSKVIDFSEGGVDPEEFQLSLQPRSTKKSILFVGRLVPYKMPEVLLHVFAQSAILKNHNLVIVGDGPDRVKLKALAEDLGITNIVKFTGGISQAEVRRFMRESSIFAFPSIREQGGGVITLAAMSGMANVVVDYGGPRYRVPDGCGIRVPLGTKDELVLGFMNALESLIQDPSRIHTLGNAAREYTYEHYSWKVKAENTLTTYQWVLGEHEKKPQFVAHAETRIQSS